MKAKKSFLVELERIKNRARSAKANVPFATHSMQGCWESVLPIYRAFQLEQPRNGWRTQSIAGESRLAENLSRKRPSQDQGPAKLARNISLSPTPVRAVMSSPVME